MTLFQDHFFLLVLLATVFSAFLALLWREEHRARRRFFWKLWVGLVGGALVLAWAMYW